MDSKNLCAFNLTRETFLSMNLAAVDSATDPLAVLKVLVEGLELNSESGFWITSLTGIPGVPRISPFDMLYLAEDKSVVRGIELLPGVALPLLEKQIVSVLVLPLHTVSSTKTQAGDRLLVCAEEEMMRHLAQISQKSGDAAVAQKRRVVESPPPPTVIPPPSVPVPAERPRISEQSQRKDVERAEQEIRAKVDSLRAASAPPMKGKVPEEQRTQSSQATPPPISKIGPTQTQTPNGADGTRKAPSRNQSPPIATPTVGLSGKQNGFTVSQAPMWRVSSPVLSTSTVDLRKLPMKEMQLPRPENVAAGSEKTEAGPGEIAKRGNAAKRAEPTGSSQPITTQASVSADASPTVRASDASFLSAFAAKTETAWVETPTKNPIPPASQQNEGGLSTEPLTEKQRDGEAAVRGEDRAQAEGTPTARPPHWFPLDRMKSSVQRIRQWLNAEAPATDRRRSERKHVPGLVAFYWTGGAPTEHRIADISETGFYLLTEDRWIKETMLQMTLQRIPGKDGRPRQSLAVLTKVVRRGRDGVGHEFVMSESLDRSSREVLPARGTDKLALGRFL